MKLIVLLALLPLFTNAVVVEKDRTITKVVKLLQDMLDKSTKEGDEETKIYAKFKCYCDQSEAEKKASIEEKTEQIALLESKIAEIQGETGELSADCADLKAKMADNEAARKEATGLREKENKAFTAEETDLSNAIDQMKQALVVLSAVGGDQTKSTGADNKQFMAGKKMLISVRSQVQDALKAASALMTSKQRSAASAFVQAPFTGTYTSQSAQVVGILKEMRDTFEKNLEDARTTEKNSKESYDAFMKVKKDAFDDMKQLFEDKQKELGDNDGELSSKKKALAEAEKQKASDEEFLGKLLPMCEEKAKGYENRKLLRANEEAAIAEAISILNSDAAFETFGTTSATKTGKTSFIQMRAVRRHETADSHNRRLAKKLLEKASKDARSLRLGKVAALLQAENAFDTVLGEIDKMLEVIVEEGKSDKQKLDWCNKERKEKKASLDTANKDITSLEKSIDKLTTTIEDPKQGLKALIQETEDNLVKNKESQTTETAERTEANVAYQADVRNLVDAEDLLTKAIKVLSAYYDDLSKKIADGEALVQEDPDAPEAWKGDGQFKGQSDKGGDVITMLEFILKETNKEHTSAHADEEKSQADYEDSMGKLKKEQAAAEKSLVKLQDDLAKTQLELLEAQEDLKETVKNKEELEAYLLEIKPGCDFITTNFKTREANRKTESDALNKAVRLIKATPAYKTAVNKATVESYGKCKEPCVDDDAHAKCKACMADVTVPAYCAGHKGTKGC